MAEQLKKKEEKEGVGTQKKAQIRTAYTSHQDPGNDEDDWALRHVLGRAFPNGGRKRGMWR